MTQKITFLKHAVLIAIFVLTPVKRSLATQNDKDIWVFKEALPKTFLCESGAWCIDPKMDINRTSSEIVWGADTDGCQARYIVRGSWTALPETLVPGESLAIHLDAFATQTTVCDAALDVNYTVSVGDAKIIPPETQPTNLNYFGSASIHKSLEKNKEFSDSKDVSWLVPDGQAGQTLQLRIAAGLGALPAGYITFVYEYQTSDSVSQDSPVEIKKEIEDDVCAIGLKKTSQLFDSLFPAVLARDSGARFADFSGEVTVASGSDPKDTQPAQMDMVLETGSIIQTESDSHAIISFADMTAFCMKPFTKVVLDTPPEKESKLSLLAGKVWMNVKKMVKDGTMNVTMNQAVAGIKGTVLILEDTGSESVLKVVDGAVEFTGKKDGSSVTVAKGELVKASENGLSAKENFDIDAERSNWQEFLESKDDSLPQTSFPLPAVGGIILAVITAAGWIIKKGFLKK